MANPGFKRNSIRPSDWAVLAALSLCVLAPIWIVRYPAIQDYWNHLLKAKIVSDYADVSLGYSRFYRILLLPIPNIASTLVLAAAMKLFAPMTAGKLFLSAYALALPLAARYLVRSAGVQYRPLQYIGFALVYNPCFWGGYIDFCMGAAAALTATGFWLRIGNKPSLRNGLAYLALVLLTYLTHFWSFALLAVVTGVLAIGESNRKRALWIGCAVVCGILLVAYARSTSERLSVGYYGASYTLSMARNFLSMPRLASQDVDTAHLASAAALIVVRLLLLGALVATATRGRSRLLWAATVLLMLYPVLPNQLGRMYEPGQRTLVVVPVILAGAATARLSARMDRVLWALVLSCAVLPALFAAKSWRAKDVDLAAYHEALRRIPPCSSVLHVITVDAPPLKWPAKLLGSDAYRAEAFFGAVYNIEKGGFYLHTFTTGMVKVRTGASPVRPWFIMDCGFEWPSWLKSNLSAVRRYYPYVVVVGSGREVDEVLGSDYGCRFRHGEVELLAKRRSI